MKKNRLNVLILLMMLFLSLPIRANAQTSGGLIEEWPLSGVYQAIDEESEIVQYYFQPDMSVVIMKVNDSLEIAPVTYTSYVIVNQEDYDTRSYPAEFYTAGGNFEKLLAQENPDYKAIYSEVSELIMPENSMQEAEILVNFRTSGFHTIDPMEALSNSSTAYVLTQPMIDIEGEVYHWRMFGHPIFSVEVGDEGATFIDSLGNQYERLSDSEPELDSLMSGEAFSTPPTQ